MGLVPLRQFDIDVVDECIACLGAEPMSFDITAGGMFSCPYGSAFE